MCAGVCADGRVLLGYDRMKDTERQSARKWFFLPIQLKRERESERKTVRGRDGWEEGEVGGLGLNDDVLSVKPKPHF